jgi:dTDP-4-amino-4,6-dideoxygalactose transaminase
MDTIQAAILNFRIKNLNKVILQRRKNAKFYLKTLIEIFMNCHTRRKLSINTYHTFVLLNLSLEIN